MFDLIISADTLVYFGALEAVFDAAYRALRPDGLLIFTVEEAGDDQPETGYRINPHGRYSHSRAYVESALTAAGFAVSGDGGGSPAGWKPAIRSPDWWSRPEKRVGIGILAAGGI